MPPPDPAPAPLATADASTLRAVLDAVGDAVLVWELRPEGPGRFLEVNEEAVRRYGYAREELLAMSPRDLVVPGSVDLPAVTARLHAEGRAAAEGLHRAKDGREIAVDVTLRRYDLDGQAVAVAVARDVSERKRRARHQRFLLDLGARLNALTAPAEVARTAVGALADVLGGLHVALDEVDPEAGVVCIEPAHHSAPPPVPPGTYPLDARAGTLDDLGGGRTVVVADVRADPRTAGGAGAVFEPAGVAAFVAVPLHHGGKWAACLHATSPAPRAWADEEVTLVERAAHLTWTAFVRARAEEAHRASEERLRLAVTAAPVTIVRIGRDHRYEWVYNPDPGAPADAIGRHAGAFLPPEEAAAYLALLDGVLATGVPARREMTFSIPREATTYDLTVSPVRDDAGAVVAVTVAAYDVTELRRAEAALRTSEERMRLAQRAARMGTWEADPATGEATWSEGMWELLGVEPRGRPPDLALWQSLIHPDDAARAAERYERALAGAEDFSDEYRMVRPSDGAVIWMASRGRVFRDEAGRAARVLGVNYDVTERRAAEDALRESEERSRRAQRAAHVGTFDLDLATGRAVWSEGVWELIGAEPDAAGGGIARWEALIHPDDRPRATERMRRALADADEIADEFRIVRPSDGAVVWVAARGRIERDADGRAARVLGVNYDVTERRAAEDALRESEAQFRRLADAMPQLVFIAEAPPGGPPSPVYYNERWYAYTGMPRPGEPGGDPLPTSWGDYLHPDDRDAAYAEQWRSAKTGTPFELEYRFRRHDGAYRWFLGRAEPVRSAAGEVVRWFGTCTDIHDRKEAEAALRESEARFRTLADSAPVLIWVSDEQNLGTYFNRRWLEFTGRTMEEELGAGWVAAVHPDDRAGAAAYCQRHFDAREEFRMEFRLRRADGQYRWVHDHGVPRYTPDGAFLGYIGSCLDVHDRKEAEAALRESEALFRGVYEQAAVGVIVIEAATGAIHRVNARYCELVGRPAEDLVGRSIFEIVHPDDREADRALFARMARGKAEEHRREKRYVLPDGAERWVAVSARRLTVADGGPVRSVNIVQDITDRKHAEEALAETHAALELANTELAEANAELEARVAERTAALRQSEALLGSVLDNALDGITVFESVRDADGAILDFRWVLANPAAAAMYGRAAEELVGKVPGEVGLSFRETELFDLHRRVVETGEPLHHRFHYDRDGLDAWIDLTVVKLGDGFAATFRDVSAEVEAEAALRASEERFRSLFVSTPIGVAVADPRGRLLEANPALHDLLGYAPGALRGTTLRELTHPADRRLGAELFGDLLAGRRVAFQIEQRYRCNDGGHVWAQTTVSAVRDGAGEVRYAIASVADVTERRRLEEAAVEAAEAERRRLSYELHDDLAQRLAGASVLAHTLAEQLAAGGHEGGPAAVRVGELVRDAMAHARALSRALAPVDLLAEGLAEALGRLCASTEAAYGVRCRTETAGPARVDDPAVATHLFRVAQEAVSNAVRHAEAREVVVRLTAVGRQLRLAVQDDGRGMPPGAFGGGAGLGLRTMRARAAALGGTLTVETAAGEGTTVTCVVPRPKKRKGG